MGGLYKQVLCTILKYFSAIKIIEKFGFVHHDLECHTLKGPQRTCSVHKINIYYFDCFTCSMEGWAEPNLHTKTCTVLTGLWEPALHSKTLYQPICIPRLACGAPAVWRLMQNLLPKINTFFYHDFPRTCTITFHQHLQKKHVPRTRTRLLGHTKTKFRMSINSH